jgi:hypothetical protein
MMIAIAQESPGEFSRERFFRETRQTDVVQKEFYV